MAWEHINLVRQVPLQYIAKLILFALASRVDDEGKCWPSIDTICHDTGLKHRTTQLHLKALVESGYVIRHERPGRPALLRLDTRMLATGVSETVPQDLHAGVHALQNSGAGSAPEVEIEQPINRQLRKLSTTTNPAAGNTAPTAWWATPAGIDEKGRELQVLARPGEGYAAYKDRLLAVEGSAAIHLDSGASGSMAMTNTGLAPARYVRTNVFEALTGYSANAIEKKIQTGAWLEGREFRRAPDGHLLIDMRGYERWVESQ